MRKAKSNKKIREAKRQRVRAERDLRRIGRNTYSYHGYVIKGISNSSYELLRKGEWFVTTPVMSVESACVAIDNLNDLDRWISSLG